MQCHTWLYGMNRDVRVGIRFWFTIIDALVHQRLFLIWKYPILHSIQNSKQLWYYLEITLLLLEVKYCLLYSNPEFSIHSAWFFWASARNPMQCNPILSPGMSQSFLGSSAHRWLLLLHIPAEDTVHGVCSKFTMSKTIFRHSQSSLVEIRGYIDPLKCRSNLQELFAWQGDFKSAPYSLAPWVR